MAIPLKLQVFEGPMDLLMHLIEKNKIDIYDIPIVTVTDQYLAYMRQMEHDDMNVTSEFLVMAATLLDIKSRMLLPKEENGDGEEEEDPREELVRRLLEYKMYKYMSEELREKNRHAGYSYFRQQDLPEEVRSYVPPLNYEELIGDRTAQSLRTVFAEVLKRKKSRVDPIRSGFGKIQREEISVADKELYIRAYLQRHPHADFREMLELEDSKEEIIVTFLVILELMKNQKIRITQEEAFGKILIDLAEPEGPVTVPEPAEEEPVEPASLEGEAEPVFMAEPESAPKTGDLSAVNSEQAITIYVQKPEAEEPEQVDVQEPEQEDLQEPEQEDVQEPEQEDVQEPEQEDVQEPAHEDVQESEQEDVQEPPRKRHLIARPRMGAAGLSRHTMPIKAKRMGKDRYLIARGSRIWSRRRNRDRRIRGYKKK